MRLTDAGIRVLKPRSETYAVYDDELRGFGVRVSAAGTKSFTLVYRLNGRKTRVNLGRFPFVNLAQARADAHKALGAVKGERKDPRTVREESGLRRAGGLTISGLTDLYLASDKFKSGRDANRDQFSRIISGEITAALGPQRLSRSLRFEMETAERDHARPGWTTAALLAALVGVALLALDEVKQGGLTIAGTVRSAIAASLMCDGIRLAYTVLSLQGDQSLVRYRTGRSLLPRNLAAKGPRSIGATRDLTRRDASR